MEPTSVPQVAGGICDAAHLDTLAMEGQQLSTMMPLQVPGDIAVNWVGDLPVSVQLGVVHCSIRRGIWHQRIISSAPTSTTAIRCRSVATPRHGPAAIHLAAGMWLLHSAERTLPVRPDPRAHANMYRCDAAWKQRATCLAAFFGPAWRLRLRLSRFSPGGIAMSLKATSSVACFGPTLLDARLRVA